VGEDDLLKLDATGSSRSRISGVTEKPSPPKLLHLGLALEIINPAGLVLRCAWHGKAKGVGASELGRACVASSASLLCVHRACRIGSRLAKARGFPLARRTNTLCCRLQATGFFVHRKVSPQPELFVAVGAAENPGRRRVSQINRVHGMFENLLCIRCLFQIGT
jgi:hypothetical protein